jgi:hypothetical protein
MAMGWIISGLLRSGMMSLRSHSGLKIYDPGFVRSGSFFVWPEMLDQKCESRPMTLSDRFAEITGRQG